MLSLLIKYMFIYIYSLFINRRGNSKCGGFNDMFYISYWYALLSGNFIEFLVGKF
jgi:hypothetical protein